MKFPSILVGSCVVAFFLLLLMIFLPGGSDIYIYSIGGKMMLSGLTPYKDFIDSKPPGIFALYALIHSTLGDGISAVRVFDALYQIVTLSFFYVLIKRYTHNSNIAALSLPIYALWYVSMGIWDTAQSESFAVLPSLIIVASVQYSFGGSSHVKKAILLGIISGISCMVLVSLKFTMLYVLVCALFVLISKHPSKRYSTIFASSSILVAGLSVLVFYHWLHSSGAHDNFQLMVAWLNGYSGNHPFNDYRTFSTIFFLRFPQALLSIYSPTFILLGVAGIIMAMKATVHSNIYKEEIFNSVFHTQLIIQLTAGLLTVLLERKNIRYHFIRSFWAFTPFIAAGLLSVYSYSRQRWGIGSQQTAVSKITKKIYIIAVLTIIFVGTPIVKVITETGSYALHSITGYETTAYSKFSDIGSEKQLLELQDSLSKNLRNGETFFFWGTIIAPYTKLNIFPPTIMMMNLQLATPWTPKGLRKQVLSQLNEKRPRYFIVQMGDFMPDLSATTYDSFGLLINWNELFEFVDINYEERFSLENFRIYEYSPEKAATSVIF